MMRVFTITSSLVALPLIFGLVSCGGSKAASTTPATAPAEKQASDPSSEWPNRSGLMKISFQNNSGAVELQLDPLDEDIEVKFSRQYIPEEKKERKVQAPPPAAPATTIVQTPAPTVQVVQAPAAKTAAQDSAQNSLMMDKKKKTQQDEKAAVEDPAKVARLVSSLQKAQQAFYTKDYEKAAEFAQQSLDVQETAEAHALKGSAEYMLKNTTQARSHWKNALSLNPNMEGVKRWLQKTGEGQE